MLVLEFVDSSWFVLGNTFNFMLLKRFDEENTMNCTLQSCTKGTLFITLNTVHRYLSVNVHLILCIFLFLLFLGWRQRKNDEKGSCSHSREITWNRRPMVISAVSILINNSYRHRFLLYTKHDQKELLHFQKFAYVLDIVSENGFSYSTSVFPSSFMYISS